MHIQNDLKITILRPLIYDRISCDHIIVPQFRKTVHDIKMYCTNFQFLLHFHCRALNTFLVFIFSKSTQICGQQWTYGHNIKPGRRVCQMQSNGQQSKEGVKLCTWFMDVPFFKNNCALRCVLSSPTYYYCMNYQDMP